MDKLPEIKRQLEAQLDNLVTRTQQIESDLRSEHSHNFSEWAAETEGDEVLEGLERASLQEIEQIRAALLRIEDGRYGICVSCDTPIGEGRLAAVPYATVCKDCAEKT